MKKDEFLNQLRIYLQGLPNDEIRDILSDYEEHFHIGISKGKTEEEISRELGDPREIAKNYKPSSSSQYTRDRNTREVNQDKTARKIFVFILLAIFNLVLVLGPFIGILGLLLGIYGVGIGFLSSGFTLLFRLPLNSFIVLVRPHILTSTGLGIGLSSLGILTLILAVYLSRIIYKLSIRYLRWNISIIDGGGVFQ